MRLPRRSPHRWVRTGSRSTAQDHTSPPRTRHTSGDSKTHRGPTARCTTSTPLAHSRGPRKTPSSPCRTRDHTSPLRRPPARTRGCPTSCSSPPGGHRTRRSTRHRCRRTRRGILLRSSGRLPGAACRCPPRWERSTLLVGLARSRTTPWQSSPGLTRIEWLHPSAHRRFLRHRRRRLPGRPPSPTHPLCLPNPPRDRTRSRSPHSRGSTTGRARREAFHEAFATSRTCRRDRRTKCSAALRAAP